tara:strand:+ start:130 stop:555 length:426 start_codon:yes stop_codon:yes gene_type:complete
MYRQENVPMKKNGTWTRLVHYYDNPEFIGHPVDKFYEKLEESEAKALLPKKQSVTLDFNEIQKIFLVNGHEAELVQLLDTANASYSFIRSYFNQRYVGFDATAVTLLEIQVGTLKANNIIIGQTATDIDNLIVDIKFQLGV